MTNKAAHAPSFVAAKEFKPEAAGQVQTRLLAPFELVLQVIRLHSLKRQKDAWRSEVPSYAATLRAYSIFHLAAALDDKHSLSNLLH